MKFSDYIIFVDESGDHGLNKINANYPLFVLAFCIFKKEDYINQVVPSLQKLKFKYWGHDDIILHEHDIRKSMNGDYGILNNASTRTCFLEDLSNIIDQAPFEIIASVIIKNKLTNYTNPSNPYELSVLFCMERLLKRLCDEGEEDKAVHLLFESRGKNEDSDLELEFRRICDNASTLPLRIKANFSKLHFNMRFVSKQTNSLGLQLADLIARPIGLSVLKPNQENQAFNIIKSKFIKHKNGEYNGMGLKIFPV